MNLEFYFGFGLGFCFGVLVISLFAILILHGDPK
jgi:hypothetical protein